MEPNYTSRTIRGRPGATLRGLTAMKCRFMESIARQTPPGLAGPRRLAHACITLVMERGRHALRTRQQPVALPLAMGAWSRGDRKVLRARPESILSVLTCSPAPNTVVAPANIDVRPGILANVVILSESDDLWGGRLIMETAVFFVGLRRTLEARSKNQGSKSLTSTGKWLTHLYVRPNAFSAVALPGPPGGHWRWLYSFHSISF